MPEETKPAADAQNAEKDAAKSRDEVALELMKFIAVTTVITITRAVCAFKTRGQLEQAKIEMRKKGRHPYYFASGKDRSKSVKIEFEDIP